MRDSITFPSDEDIIKNFNKSLKRYCFEIEDIDQKSVIGLDSNNEPLFLYRLNPRQREPFPGIQYTLVKYFVINSKGEVIGRAPVSHTSISPKEADIVYSLNEQFRGQGIGTKMLKSVLYDIFNNQSLARVAPSLEKVWLEIKQENLASRRIAEKNGFKQTQPERYEILKNDFLKEAQPE